MRRRHSLYGVRFWLSQRAIEGAFRRFASYLQGTWFMSLYLRALGAKIGAWVTFRYCNLLIAPDMLDIGEGTHVGDLANIITSCALDASAVLVAPVQIGKQAIFGTTAVIMPGSILGKGALVGAIAATDIGQELAGDTLYMGAPAMATNKHDSGSLLCCTMFLNICEAADALQRYRRTSHFGCLSSMWQASLGKGSGKVDYPMTGAVPSPQRAQQRWTTALLSCPWACCRGGDQAQGRLPARHVLPDAGHPATGIAPAGWPMHIHHCLGRRGCSALPAIHCASAGALHHTGSHRVPCMHPCSALLGADGARADAPPLSLLGLCCCC